MNGWRVLVVALFAIGTTMVDLPTAFAADDDGEEASVSSESSRGPTIVTSRVPKLRPLKVRRKFFLKAGRVEITPMIGLVTSNALNDEMVVGAGVTYHFSERLGLEVLGSYGVLGGASNRKELALAVLRLLDSDFRLESVDPGLFATVSLVWTPMYGKINPFGLAVINLDFYFLLGLGYANETIEMLSYQIDDAGREDAALAFEQMNHKMVIDFGFGAQFYASRSFSLRLEGRLYLTWQQVLDYSTPENASNNRDLPENANRLTCTDADEATQPACKLTFPTTLVLGIGGSFWAPGDKVVRAKLGNP